MKGIVISWLVIIVGVILLALALAFIIMFFTPLGKQIGSIIFGETTQLGSSVLG